MQSSRLFSRVLLIPLLALAAACGGDKEPAGVIPREKFVAANVALRSLPDSATPQQRAATLRKHGVTEQQLKVWINGHVREPQAMAKAWEEIAFKLDSMGSAPPPPPPGEPTPGVPPVRPQPKPAPVGIPGGRVAPPPPSTDARPAIVREQ